MSEDKRRIITENTDNKSAEPGSGGKKGQSASRAVTSDAKNSSSAYAGSSGILRNPDSAADDNMMPDDDILELIRLRQSMKKAQAEKTPEPDNEILDKILADFAEISGEPEEPAESENREEPAETAENVEEPAEAAENEEEPAEAAETEIWEELAEAAENLEEPADAEITIDEAVAEEPQAAEPIAKSAAAEEGLRAVIIPAPEEETAEEDSEPEEVSVQEPAEPEEAPMSELEKELAADFADRSSEEKAAKRYGFKPYTRELQAEEIKHLQDVSREAQTGAGAAGNTSKMAKVSGQNKKKSGAAAAAGASKASKKPDKNARASGSSGSSKDTKPKKKSESKAKSDSKKPPKKKKKWVGFVRAFVRTIIVCCIIAMIAAAGYVANIISHAPTIHPKGIYDTLDVSTHIYDDKENLIDEIYYTENRQIVSYEQLPENLKNAFIAVEDKTFWTHRGFNFRRIIGAILERFHGGRISGTSTITQQLARNVFLPDDKSVRSIKRKIVEMYYAYQIEQELSKEEILTAYLNTIYLGYGCYGVDTAAKTYFSSNVENLTLEQCAALAALPQAPGTYSLLVTEPTDTTVEFKNGIYINDASQDRRNMILNMMLQQGLITEEEKEAAIKPLADFIKPGSTDSAASQSAFKDYLIETVKKDLMNEYGIEEDQAIKIIYTKGLNIYTTMDSQAQKAVTEQFKKKGNFPSTVNGKGTVESACVVCEVGTGEIKAMVGTRKATGQMLFNRATNPRQPGSSIKPLSVYAAALQKSYEYQKGGKKFKFKKTGYDKQGTSGWGDYITVSSKVVDEKMTVNGKTWPLNVTRSYSGNNTFRTAIQKSINTCSVKILSQIGIEYSMDTLKRFGITSAIDDSSQSINDLNLAALGLGAMSYGISPLEMSAAYATFPNGGVVNSPIVYTKVEDSSGRTLLEGKSTTTKVLDEGVAWIMTDVLKSVVTKGIAGNAKVKGIEVGGKTGTTDDRFDIWFNGFTPSYSVALWIGTDDNVQMDSASEKAASLWSKIVSHIDEAKKGEYRKRPDNVIRAWNGEYYTRGTAPPEPPPEPDPEEEAKKAAEKAAKEGITIPGTGITIPTENPAKP